MRIPRGASQDGSHKQQVAKSMHASGEHDIASIARVLGVSRASVYRGLSTA